MGGNPSGNVALITPTTQQEPTVNQAEHVDQLRELITLDELCNRTGMSVRNVRFYTTRGLVPPPIRRGRSGYYSPDHVVRLELVKELQAHGFTLSAIEKYVARIPTEASPGDIALHRTLLTPWGGESGEELTKAELQDRAGRPLSSNDLASLETLGVIRPGRRGHYRVSISHLSVSIAILDLGFPLEAAEEARRIYEKHGREIAEEINEVFRAQVWPAIKENASTEQLPALLEHLKPLSIAGLVTAYEEAVDQTKREQIAKRAR